MGDHMIRVLLVEDNDYERQRLVQIINANTEGIKVYEAEKGSTAINIIKNHDIDLFLMDIELPDISGIKLAEKIRKVPKYEFAHMVFITTHGYLLLDALKKIHCYDFIVKPYENKEIVDVINKLTRAVIRQKKEHVQKREEIRFKLKSCILRIYVDEILFIESQGRNCIIHTKKKEYEISNYNMSKMLSILPQNYFMQTHKSYIVNINNIREVDKRERNSWTVFFDDYDIPAFVGNTYKNHFIERTNDVRVVE